jgi:hypothetical protein
MKHAHARHHTAKEATAPVAATPEAPSKDEFVREAAYYYYEQRGRIGGYELDDWLRAEAEFERLNVAPAGDAETAGH